jgi:hypothetical protein
MALRDDTRRLSDYPERYGLLAEAVGGRLVVNGSGCYCRIDTRMDGRDLLGRVELRPLLATTAVPVAAFTSEEMPGQVPLSDIVFVDTETTGLGGTGTVPFLIGVGSVTPDGFEIRQYLLPDYSDEAALLADLRSEFSTETSLASYNGAAFDLPLIRDRLVLNRVAREIPCARHFDLLHSARRLFKRRLKDCSLVNVEREVFGHVRGNDIPGYLIPSVYFEWLNEQATDNLQLVLAHNRQDIVTLFYLCHQIAAAFASEGKTLGEIDDLHSLSRVFGRRRDIPRAVAIYDRMERETDGHLAEDVLLYHSFILKRGEDWSRATALWHDLAKCQGREGYWACIELAKYFERREPDLDRAGWFAHRAMDICPYGEEHRRKLTERLERISRKQSR